MLGKLSINVQNSQVWSILTVYEFSWSRLCYSVASVCRLSSVVCDVCIVAKRCILEQKLLLTVVYYIRAQYPQNSWRMLFGNNRIYM